METNNKYQYEKHTFKSFIQKYDIVIPMVQRDYAQGRNDDNAFRVRTRFLNSIYEYLVAQDKQMKLDFVYGEVDKKWSTEEAGKLEAMIVTPLDGQQRLTTLYLLYWYAAKIALQEGMIKTDDYDFLYNFSYDVRPSSRDFCEQLVAYNPDFAKTFSEQITDQGWYQADWKNDSTINGMLVMLDAIKVKFANVKNLWDTLTSTGKIIFFFLPLSENGHSDELYIKMNSRGKALTPFEHFKADFEELFEKDSEKAQTISHKFDVDWTDMLFPYRDESNTIDNEWMRYFLYISHILCYKQGIQKSDDEFELIESLYAKVDINHPDRNPQAENNKAFLEKAMDCWANIGYDSVDCFFSKYFVGKVMLGTQYDSNKVCTFKNNEEYSESQNFFAACCKLYAINTNAFSYGDILFLYGIIIYLLNKEKVEETKFIRRIRILRNLIWNSTHGEIRADMDYMQDLLAETENVILYGKIERTPVENRTTHGFNEPQEKEENKKINQVWSEQEYVNLCKLEDSHLLYGQVSILGLDNVNNVDIFYSVFSQQLKEIHRALLSVGDYTQENGLRRFMGNDNVSTWQDLFHESRRNGRERTSSILLKLLSKVRKGENTELIINEFLNACKTSHRYNWRYYFVKYPSMLRGSRGIIDTKVDTNYIWTSLNQTQYNGKHWLSFANAINEAVADKLKKMGTDNIKDFVVLYDYDESLSIPSIKGWLEFLENKFVLHIDETIEDWDIPSESGVDIIDRVIFCVDKIMGLIQNA